MAAKKAHTISDRERTEDIHTEENVDFAGMYLSDHVLEGLKKSGFIKPSPIQLAAIPLGRCGLDLVVQAKSGTGKTCVFTVVALEMLSVTASTTQVLVIAPTREIAVQIAQVINAIGIGTPGLRAYAFIGGIPLSQDKAKLSCCHIVVGTPGRLTQLVELGLLKLDNVRLLVLDEADQLLTGQFTKGVISLASALPLNKQILALSATYTDDVAKVAEELMRSPNHVRLGRDCPALLGVNQFTRLLPFHHQPHRIQQTKMSELLSILSTVTFNQCLVFTNSQLRAESICNELRATGWPVAYLTGGQAQRDRLQALDALCSYKCRILISTDLSARGLDSEHVNLVINLDMPRDQATYLHRVGRAGRFGSRGGAITLATEGDDWTAMRAIVTLANVKAYLLQEGWASNITSKEVGGMEEVEMLEEEELNLWLEINKKKGFSQEQKVMKSIQNGNVEGERITESVGKKSTSKAGSYDESEKENQKDKSVTKKSHKHSKAAVKQENKMKKSDSLGNSDKMNTIETISNNISCKKEISAEEVKKKASEKKAENQKKVSALLSRVNSSFLKFSYAEIYKKLSEKCETENDSDYPAVTIPSLPVRLNPSESELKVLCDHIEDTNEELENKIASIDEFWRSSRVSVKDALQALIEGKDPGSLPHNNDHKESGSDLTDNVHFSEANGIAVSPGKAIASHEFNGIAPKNTSDCADKVTESSLSERESKVNTDSVSGLYQSSKSTTQSTSDLCSSKKTSNSGGNKEKIPRAKDTKEKVKKSRSQPKQSQDLAMKKEPKSKKTQKKQTKRSTSTSTGTSFDSSSSTSCHNKQSYYGFYDSQQQQRDYWSHLHGMYGTGYQQYAHADHPSYGEAYQNFQPAEGEAQWNQQHHNSYYTGYPYDWDDYTTSAYSYKKAYVESAQKFASMMDYVQSMGRMSAWIARDYHSRSQNADYCDKCSKKKH
ncbi:probable ATP-dependent RNA helicase DDX20 [Penaeus japonicus]|uniref:probable ATP-dependent RNA helicase DDX20 n=1 Tax=Penaeus japonicus TaxID=27405 RepID=UPI001C70BFD3|nr:probable ATP-dependent RNA helicase DDX20 [Penaeus japonicus]XP_042873124.1 probable ATP-dependent RNA helicase DDX20 [Penaeus japonicus]XP_042873125.1 probable ATP-dependent RNA helicase DDX20 [Penaeus japonicus]XP_042873126.1 probable ATP-dependent RNA helicase DDX20 [Penaeus japonicus]XP_042873127.1 probable ATP-dependent RNA helicase DDX20 [Penaeus japonicus]